MRGYGVVLLELVGTRARQGDDVGQFKMADSNDKGFGEAAPAEETVRRRAACVSGPAVHVRWCVDFGLGSGISECGNRRVCRGRSREKPEPEPEPEQEAEPVAEAEARDRIGLVSAGRLAL